MGARKSHIISEATRLKMSLVKKGKPPWNKGIQMWKDRPHPKGTLGMKFNGRKFSEEWKKNLSEAHKGKKLPWSSGKNHWNWKGGVSGPNELSRKSAQYKLWRHLVFERDNYTCQRCGQVGGELHADHIKPFATHPKLRLELSNGRTLCKDCHKKTDTYGVRKRKK